MKCDLDTEIKWFTRSHEINEEFGNILDGEFISCIMNFSYQNKIRCSD